MKGNEEVKSKSNSLYSKREKGDYEIEWRSATGPGGQNKNKTQNCARVHHIPTGIVKSAKTRSRENSLKNAMTALNQELDRLLSLESNQTVNSVRKIHVGTGDRAGDRTRTYQDQNNLVKDHATGKQAPFNLVLAGQIDRLW
jgi:peptide chain release factor 1